MNPETESSRCIACHEPMGPGTRFCVSCGKHNFDPGELLGKPLARRAESVGRDKAALQRMKSVWPSWDLRWWLWFFR